MLPEDWDPRPFGARVDVSQIGDRRSTFPKQLCAIQQLLGEYKPKSSFASGSIGRSDLLELSDLSRSVADAFCEILSQSSRRDLVTVSFDPGFGKLHANRVSDEPFIHMAWDCTASLFLRPEFEMRIGIYDLCFSSALTPRSKNEQVSLYSSLIARGDMLRQTLWQNSIAFTPGSRDLAWMNWGESWKFILPFDFNNAPKRLGFLIEENAFRVPDNDATFFRLVSGYARRMQAVLDLF